MFILQLLPDRWVTLTSSYCIPDEIPAIDLLPETTEKRSVFTEEVTENHGHVTKKLEAYTVTSAANPATPFCMTFGSGQSSGESTDAVLAHVYISQEVTVKHAHDDVTTAINKWIDTLAIDSKPKYSDTLNYFYNISRFSPTDCRSLSHSIQLAQLTLQQLQFSNSVLVSELTFITETVRI